MLLIVDQSVTDAANAIRDFIVDWNKTGRYERGPVRALRGLHRAL